MSFLNKVDFFDSSHSNNWYLHFPFCCESRVEEIRFFLSLSLFLRGRETRNKRHIVYSRYVDIKTRAKFWNLAWKPSNRTFQSGGDVSKLGAQQSLGWLEKKEGWLAVIKRVSSFRHFQRIYLLPLLSSLFLFFLNFLLKKEKGKVEKNSSRRGRKKNGNFSKRERTYFFSNENKLMRDVRNDITNDRNFFSPFFFTPLFIIAWLNVYLEQPIFFFFLIHQHISFTLDNSFAFPFDAPISSSSWRCTSKFSFLFYTFFVLLLRKLFIHR